MRPILWLSPSLLFAFFSVTSYSQTHFRPLQRTGDNATIGIPGAVRPSIDSLPLANGDEVAAFTREGLCVGVTTWNDSGAALTVWGDDIFTPEVDGMVPGDTLCYRVWSAKAHAEFTDVEVTYHDGNGLYICNGMYEIASMNVGSACSVSIDSLSVVPLADASVRVRWWTSEEGETEEFGVERSQTSGGGFAPLENGVLPSHPRSSEVQAYEVTDRSAPAGMLYYRLRVRYQDGADFLTAPQSVNLLTGLSPSGPTNPASTCLLQNYPNPFNPSTTFVFQVSGSGPVSLKVYDLTGREVAVVVEGRLGAGVHQERMDFSSFATGRYLCRLVDGNVVQVKALTFLK
jgi:hypothetical protein